ncbi:hypothetical protein EJ110_NYTH43505 [Nymphaea thermarum]|nr:hypothetical protein EJ110_NYTH43505 [Nymphaea thermarum]
MEVLIVYLIKLVEVWHLCLDMEVSHFSSFGITNREVLQSGLIFESPEISVENNSALSLDEEDVESELLLHFLVTLKEQKHTLSCKLVEDIGSLEADILEVERRQALLQGNSFLLKSHKEDKAGNDLRTQIQDITENLGSACQNKESLATNVGGSSWSPISCSNEARILKNISQLEDAYFSMRSKLKLAESENVTRTDRDVLRNQDRCSSPSADSAEGSKDSDIEDTRGAFFDGFCRYARYSKFVVRGVLRNGDLLNSANVICSLSFDRDEEYFAAAGVSKKVKIFEFQSLMNGMVDIHYPVIEMSSRSKLSCVCWNSYIKNYLASTDYDGVVQLWDANSGQGFMNFGEHQKRAWSVDFSVTDPTKLASGSDDCSVKLWSIKEKNSISTIRNHANVCCVQFSPYSTHLLSFGSADYKVFCYDLRNTRVPWCTLAGHEKAVSYVKFLDASTVISASTDNKLKIWDLNRTNYCGLSSSACSLTLKGHTNEKNFVGLSVSDGYIACGSETNEVYAYHRSLPMPITSHKFGALDPVSGQEIGDDNGLFVSSVCWREKSNMVVAANSNGNIKLLELV